MNKVILSVRFLAIVLLAAQAAYAITPQDAAFIARYAENGNDGAQVLLATMYLTGDGGYGRSPEMAAKWLEKAAVQGNAYAQLILGDMYEDGRGVEKNLKVAADWREKASHRGNCQAQQKLGLMYQTGAGVNKDKQKADYWLNRAAIEGGACTAEQTKSARNEGTPATTNPTTPNKVASGIPPHQDIDKIVHLVEYLEFQMEEILYQRSPELHRLAEDGDHLAQYDLAVRYENGSDGEARNFDLALRWYTRAAEGGNVAAMERLTRLYETGQGANSADARYWRERVKTGAKR